MKYAGFVTTMVLSGLASWLYFNELRTKSWNRICKSAVLALLCLMALLISAVIGVLIIQTGSFGMARGWSSFANAYLWGVFLMPLGIFFVCLAALYLLPYSGKRR